MRVAPISPDRYPGPLCHGGRATTAVTANARHPVAFGEDVVNDETLSKIGARVDRRVDQDRVECGAPGAVAESDAVDAHLLSSERKIALIERPRSRGRTTRRRNGIEQAPARETARAVAMDEMSVGDVAGKGSA